MPSAHTPARAYLASLLLCIAVSVHAQGKLRVDEIRFIGNKVTKPSVMLHEMTFEVGDAIDQADVEESRQAIMNLGLFQKVDAEIINEGGRRIVQVAVKEKIYLLPLPRINRNADGDISYGGQLRWDNFLGLNQQVKITQEQIKPSQNSTSNVRELSVDYAWPRIQGSPYSFSASGTSKASDVDATADGFPEQSYHLHERSVSFTVSRLLKDKGPTRGWSVSSGLHWSYAKHFNLGELPPDRYRDLKTVGWNIGAGFSDVRDYLYSRAGEEHGYNIDLGMPWLGSDYAYNVHNLYLRRYYLITERPHVNLNMQLRMGVASGSNENFVLGGSDTLRGYQRDSVKGNAFLLANFEYQQPILGDKRWRGVAFFDLGNAYAGLNDINPLKMKASVGVGLRFRIISLVKVQLRLDYGYAVANGDNKAYAGSNESF